MGHLDFGPYDVDGRGAASYPGAGTCVADQDRTDKYNPERRGRVGVCRLF